MNLINYSIKDFENLFNQIFDGKIHKNDIKDFLLNLNKANLPQNSFIAAINSLKKRMKRINSPLGAIDVCGTGGDKLNTLNISTAVSFVIAGCGVCVAKHGNKAISSNSGSADIFQELGIKIYDEEPIIEKILQEKGLCFLFAPLFHQSLKHVAIARKELGVATIFNFLGPLLNPANTKYQLIGTSNKGSMIKLAKVIAKEQSEHGQDSQVFIVHGYDGMDEITLSDNSCLVRCCNGQISDEENINPQDFGFNKINIKEIIGKDPKYNAQKLIELLQGAKSSYRNIVILNAAYALIAAKKIDKINLAIEMAQDAIDSNRAFSILQSLRQS